MVTLEDIRNEFLKASYAPDPDCEYCHGSGTRGPRKVICVKSDLSVVTEERPDEGYQPCICIFVGDPRIRKIAVDAFKELAAEARETLSSPPQGTRFPSGGIA